MLHQQTLLKMVGLIILIALLSSCSSVGIIFLPYGDLVRPALQQLDTENPLAADVALSPFNRYFPHELLYYVEAGRIAQIQGQISASQQYWMHVRGSIDQTDAGPLVDVSDLSQQGLALAINDKARDYMLPAYQKSFLHTFQAWNYLQLHQLDDASVEARQEAYGYQQAVNQNEAARKYIEKQVNRLSLDPKILDQAVDAQWIAAENIALPIYSFSNAYANFMNGFIFELKQQWNDALIEYKKALALNSTNLFIQKRTWRVANKLGLQSQVTALMSKPAKVTTAKKASSEIIVIYEQGWIPELESKRITVAWNQQVQSMELPTYRKPWAKQMGLSVQVDGHPESISQPLLDVYGLAIKSLQEQAKSRMIRQLLRVAVKYELNTQAQQRGGDIGLALSSMYGIVSEQADLRTWLSLPNTVHLASFLVEPGAHKIEWRDQTTGLTQSLALQSLAHHTQIIRVMNTGNRYYSQTVDYENSLL